MTVCPKCSRDVLNERGRCNNCGYQQGDAKLRNAGPHNSEED